MHFLEDFGSKSALLGQIQCFLVKKCTMTWYILHIILNLICKFAITHKNDAKIANARLTKTFVAIFALAERRPTSATLEHTIFPYCQGSSRGAQQRPSLLEFITQITCAYYTDDADDDWDDDYDLS